MRYFLIAGEASGDLHASNLMEALSRIDGSARFRFMGGDLMASGSDGMVMHYRETSYMMLDVLLHLRKILRNMKRVRREIRLWQPDAVILVDYPGFNLRIASFAYRLDIKVFYYIPPKVWAWRRKRMERLRKYTHRVFVIFPFEEAFYHDYDMRVEYFGNPLVDAVEKFRRDFRGIPEWKASHGLDERPVVALLAGSRRKEIERMMPVMVKMASRHPGYQFVVGEAPSIDPFLYQRYLDGSGVKLVHDETYALLESAHAGVITSGTATLEGALLDVPQVVLYRTGWLAYLIGKRIIKTNFISLVNLIFGEELVQEIIQRDIFDRGNRELSRILEDEAYRAGILEGYRGIRSLLGERGVSDRIGRCMLDILKADLE